MAAKKRKYQCVQRGTRKVIQDVGPAKTVRYCKKKVPYYSAAGKAYRKKHGLTASKRKGRKGKSKYCVYRGKSPVPVSCHLKKSTATKTATRLRKACKRQNKCKVGVKKKAA